MSISQIKNTIYSTLQLNNIKLGQNITSIDSNCYTLNKVNTDTTKKYFPLKFSFSAENRALNCASEIKNLFINTDKTGRINSIFGASDTLIHEKIFQTLGMPERRIQFFGTTTYKWTLPENCLLLMETNNFNCFIIFDCSLNSFFYEDILPKKSSTM